MRVPPATIYVEFWVEGSVTILVALALLQAPSVGESMRFAKLGSFSSYVVTKVEWFVGLTDAEGKVIKPGPSGQVFQTAHVELRPA